MTLPTHDLSAQTGLWPASQVCRKEAEQNLQTQIKLDRLIGSLCMPEPVFPAVRARSGVVER